MLISKKRKFIFVHIYKNAGSSVTNALMPFASSKWQQTTIRALKILNISLPSTSQPFPDHIKASDIVNTIGKEAYDSFFSFAIIRNPWDWQVSLYKYMLKSPAHRQHNLVKSLGSFDQYIKWRCTEEVRFQKDFIYSEDGELLVDFVGRFERIDSDFEEICSRIGVSASLPKLNISNTRPYQQFYNEETCDLVRKTFDTDISLFGYNF